jgi:RNA polymerase sigma-70 factor (ECF subfamily)
MDCKTWLFQILFDVIHRQHRRQEPRFSPSTPDEVVSALNRVPPDFREVLLLIDCQGFSYKSAAEILGLSVDVIARRIVLGRNHLYSELAACRSTLAAAAH